ncbi:MAG TPA: bacillithiol biosynthesis cysteine-adding enzyme BshC [Sphingobacteriaceae bacterium]
MKATYIDYKETCSFSPAVIRYLEKDPQLQSFISHYPDPDGFAKVIAERKVLGDRIILTDVLRKQYDEAGAVLHQAVQANLEKLTAANTFTVTTGHQLNIFTGPLYFIYKIVTTIKLAKELKAQFPDKNFVPVYWMATEDHDFAEINHTRISGKKITWDETVTGATGRLNPKGLARAVKEYQAVLGVNTFSNELSSLVEAAYAQPSLALATRYLVNELFGEYGLIVTDGDHPELKSQFSRIIEEDIFHQHSYRCIESTNRDLDRAGIKSQVNPREINFFYIRDDLRERIVQENGRYYILNTEQSFSPDELRQEIRQFPERFSPNVVMRPLFQELILPNIAYIGGGAEVIYWLELKSTFDHYQVDFPIVMLRNSALVAAESLRGRLSRAGLDYQAVFRDPAQLKKQWVLDNSGLDLRLRPEWLELSNIFEKMKSKAGRIDKTLEPSTEAIMARLNKALDNLEKKMLRAEKRKHEASLNQITAIKDKYFPNGSLQERTENFGAYYAKYGQDFIRGLLDAFQPLEFRFSIIEFEEKN